MDNHSTFIYTYSAQQNQEIQAIRQKYLPKEESALEELRRLDRNVQTSGILESLSVGIIGCLIFGFGMCLGMKVIGNSVLLGILVSISGTVIIISAYPIYRSISGKMKAKLTPRILQLTSQLIA